MEKSLGLLLACVLCVGCLNPFGGEAACPTWRATGFWSEPGLWSWVHEHVNETGLEVHKSGSEPGPMALHGKVASPWNGTVEITWIRWADYHGIVFELRGFSDSGASFFGAVASDLTSESIRPPLTSFLASFAVNASSVRPWTDKVLSTAPARQSDASTRQFYVDLDGPMDAQRFFEGRNATFQFPYGPGLGVLNDGGWSVFMSVEQWRLGAPGAYPWLTVDAGDMVAAGQALGPSPQDSEVQANATSLFAHWHLPPPTFQHFKGTSGPTCPVE